MINLHFRKNMANNWFEYLQAQICREFEILENNNVKFYRKDWSKKNLRRVEAHHIFYLEEKFSTK